MAAAALSTTDTPLVTPGILRRLLDDLPEDSYTPQPLRALWMFPIFASVVIGMVAIVQVNLAWYWALPISVLIGNSIAMMGLLAHEIMHGATVQPRWQQTFFGYFGFGPFLVSPDLWRFWHNGVHHGNTNVGNRDPDGFGTMKRYEKQPSTRFVVRLAPGSGRWYSYFFLFYWFTFHGQVVLWIQTAFMKGFERFHATRAKVETCLFIGLWLALGVAVGWRHSLFIIVIPMAAANFIAMSYIATNHFLRPQTDNTEPVDNSMGVRTIGLVDRLHWRFSHHVEHHYFPAMPGSGLPRVRAWFDANEPDRFVAPAHWKAVHYLYKTPRVYSTPDTLTDPDDPTRTADIADVTRALLTAPAR